MVLVTIQLSYVSCNPKPSEYFRPWNLHLFRTTQGKTKKKKQKTPKRKIQARKKVKKKGI